MLQLFLCAAILLLSFAQLDSSEFHIEIVTAYTKYDSRYILRLANQLVPPDKVSKKDDIECLVNELKASGIFADVRAELRPGKTKNGRRLDLTTVYHPQVESFIISQITLDGFPQIDKVKFQSALNEKGITPGIRFLTYPASVLEKKISKALLEVYPDNSAKDDMNPPWIMIRPGGTGEVKLIVSPTYLGCNNTASLKQ